VRALRREDPRLTRYPVDEVARRDHAVLDTVHRDLVLTGKLRVPEARVERMVALYGSFGVPLGRTEARRLVAVRRRAYAAHQRAVPGSVALLRALRAEGAKVGIVTNNLVREQRRKLRQVGLHGLYDTLTISEEAGVTKPDPRIFQLALTRTGLSPAESVMVGDSWAADVEGARAAGIPAIWFDRSDGPRGAHRNGVPVLRSYRPLRAALRLLAEAADRPGRRRAPRRPGR
jgi:HAD superfamily hydrolase (TIGR01509 family)